MAKRYTYICEECFEEFKEKDIEWVYNKERTYRYVLCKECDKILKNEK